MTPSRKHPSMTPLDIHTHHLPDEPCTAIVNVEPDPGCTLPQSTCSVGIHPWRIADAWGVQMDTVARLATHPQVVALGECGLDKVCLKALPPTEREAAFARQMQVFEAHIRLSEACGKPLMVHCVRACNELVALRRKHRARQAWVIHGFRGNGQVAASLLAAGCHLSFGEHYQAEALLATPSDRLFIETDESLLPISTILANVAHDRGLTPEQLSLQLQTNYSNTFLHHIGN